MKIIFFSLFISLIIYSCSEEPPPTHDWSINPFLEEEAKNIPWEDITGKIVYCNQKRGIILLINGYTQELSIITNQKLSSLVWHPQDGTFSGLHSDDFINFIIGIGKVGFIPQLYTYNVDGQSIQTNYSNLNSPFAWSSDLKIAHLKWGVQGAFIDNNLFVSDVHCYYTRPAWSYDDNYIILSQNQDSLYSGLANLVKIGVIDTIKNILIQANEDSIIFRDPIYSPDGNKILYVRFDLKYNKELLGASEIWEMNSDGSNNRRLTSDFYDFYPAWSPNGEKIIFSRQTRNKNEYVVGSIGMYIMNTDGSELKQFLSEGSVYASWKH